jgi:hypothetical protein
MNLTFPIIPFDIIEYILVDYIPETFLSTNKRFNDIARLIITHRVDEWTDKYLCRLIRNNPTCVKVENSYPYTIFMRILGTATTSTLMFIINCIYLYDSVNCLELLINTGCNIGLYSFESVFVNRSFKCLKQILDFNDGKFANLAQVHALRFDDAEMLAVVFNSRKLSPTPGKLYCALLERRINCYRYLLNRVTPTNEVYEFLVSQDLPLLLDETLEHDVSWDFKKDILNSVEFHRFVGESSNLPTLRVLLKYGFNPLLHNGMAIRAAACNNMGAAIILSKFVDKMSSKVS